MSFNKNVLLLGTVGALAACCYSGPRYVPRPNVPLDQYTLENKFEDRSDRRTYNAYEFREPCQHYRRVPRNSVVLNDCMVAKAPTQYVTETTTTTTTTLLPIVHSYTIYFKFDSSKIEPGQIATFEKLAHEISKYQPSDITVTGYTDRAGTVAYNQKLSRRRADAVSAALRDRGLVNEEIDEGARGEFDNAVPTPDGVKLPENRRVVIDFRR